MTPATRDELARTLDDLVRSVPGVKTIYRSTSVLAGVASVVRPVGTDEPLVRVEEKSDTLTVTVTIAAEAPATVTCCTVYDTIADHLLGLGVREPVVRVTVGQVIE